MDSFGYDFTQGKAVLILSFGVSLGGTNKSDGLSLG